MINKISKQVLFISLFFVFLFWLLLLLGLRITNSYMEMGFNIVVGIFAVIGLILLSLYMKQAFWKAILRSILLSTVLLSFFLAWANSVDYSNPAFKNFPLQCGEIASPDGQKTFVVISLLPPDAMADVGWIYYKNLPFIGKPLNSVNSCSSRWIDNDTIVAPASSYLGIPEQIAYAGLEFNWSILLPLAVISLFSYAAITLLEFFLRIIKMLISSRLKTALKILFQGQSPSTRSPIPAITADEVAETRQFFAREKFFIFGHARSGTTLLMRLARLHAEVHCSYQAHFFTREPFLKSLVDSPAAAEWLSRKSNRWNQGRDLSPLVLRATADFILERDAAREGKSIVGDKSPSSLIHGQAVRDMAAVYPDAALVYIVRDGRDVLISERFRNFVEDSKYLTAEDKRIITDLKADQTPFTDGRRSIFTDAFIRRAAVGWVANLTETDAEGRRLYGERYFSLRYEDLLTSPFAEMQKLWAFLGVTAPPPPEAAVKDELASNPDETWQAKRNESIASFLPKGHAGNWRKMFTKHDQQVFKEVAGEMLVKWGYEDSVDW